jgi:hypothetical protein
MQSLAPRSASATAQAFILQHSSQPQRRLDHEVSGDTLARIEIKDEHVGTLDVIDARVPGVQLDRADLDQAK